MQIHSFNDFGLIEGTSGNSIKLFPLSERTYKSYLRRASPKERAWLKREFKPAPQEHAYRYRSLDMPSRAFVYASEAFVNRKHVKSFHDDRFMLSGWATELFPGTYRLADDLRLTPQQQTNILFGWGAGSYRFDRYKSHRPPRTQFLEVPACVDAKRLLRELNATYYVQNLINEPPNILNCEALTEEARQFARQHKARISVTKGKDLVARDYHLIHTVGKGSHEEPRLIDIRWGDPTKPQVTLVGKGVVFDSGGKDLKLAGDNMADMKYDMAGAAHALGVAYMVIDANLPVSLRVLLPVVENAIGAKSYNPGDIVRNRRGESIQIVNTDAEGRLILADALHEAAHPRGAGDKKPSWIVSFGTTGWYGYTELPGWGALYANHESVQEQFLTCAQWCQEYFAERPFLKPLMQELRPSEGNGITDLLQCIDSHDRYDGLNVFNFLNHHVDKAGKEKGRTPRFIYADIIPWRESHTTATQYPPGLPPGGFALGVRTTFRFIEQHCG